MEKIFFFANFFPEDFTRGITKKVWAQMYALKELGYEVTYYTGYLEDGVAVFDSDGKVVKKKKYSLKKINHIYRNQILKKTAAEFIKTNGCHIDIVYARYLFFDANYIRMLKRAQEAKCKIIVEAHSYPTYIKGEYIMYPTYLIDYFYKRVAPKYVDLVAAVSSVHNIWGIKTVNIDNGIDFIKTKAKKTNSTMPTVINIICVSYESSVHGYDRMIRGLGNYYRQEGKIEVRLLLVGTVLNETLKLIQKEGIADYVEILGTKGPQELDEIYDRSNIGMGLLAPHRMGTLDSSGLKTKEYIAKGIPFFYAGYGLECSGADKFTIRFDANDDPIDVEKIVLFYLGLEKEGLEQRIRNWGKPYSWTYQLEKVMKVLYEQ